MVAHCVQSLRSKALLNYIPYLVTVCVNTISRVIVPLYV